MSRAVLTTKKVIATAIAAVAVLAAGISAPDAKADVTWGTRVYAQPYLFATSAKNCPFRATWTAGGYYFKREGTLLAEWLPSLQNWWFTYGKARLYYSQGGPYQLGPCQYFDHVSNQWVGAPTCSF